MGNNFIIEDKKTIDAELERYIKETDELIAEIETSPTTVTVKGTKYYVAADGDDSNDGRSPEKAWKSVERVNKEDFAEGDGVFFKRGDKWRITSSLMTKKGVTYSAFGTGAKPKLIASIDGSGEDKWEKTEFPDIYKYTAGSFDFNHNVGLIVFDDGKAWGIQVQKKKNGERLANGLVFNGLETYVSDGGAFDDLGALSGNLEFYNDFSGTGELYLCCRGGNPGKLFGSIEILVAINAIRGCGDDVVIDNIEIFGPGRHGIGYGSVKNLEVRYCTLRWIGGSVQGMYIFGRDYGTRLGNAVESYGSSDGISFHHCYASQIYDCCWTVQCLDAVKMNNVKMYKNVTEFCNTGLEVWNGGGEIKNMDLHDNYTRYNGYGWSHQRPNKDGNFFYGGSNVNCEYENNRVWNNVNYFTSENALLVCATGPSQYNFHDNVYFMEKGRYLGGIAKDPSNGEGGFVQTPYDREHIEAAVATGFEKGGKFYITEKEPFGMNMYCLAQKKSK